MIMAFSRRTANIQQCLRSTLANVGVKAPRAERSMSVELGFDVCVHAARRWAYKRQIRFTDLSCPASKLPSHLLHFR